MAGGAYKVPHGEPLTEVIWKGLIECIDALMSDQEGLGDWTDPDRFRAQGKAEGISWVLAVLLQSPRPIDINEIKDEAMERWRAAREDPGGE